MVITDILSFILFFLLFVSFFLVNVYLMFYLARSSIDKYLRADQGYLNSFVVVYIYDYMGCVTAVQFILFNFANYAPSIAVELKVSKEITCK